MVFSLFGKEKPCKHKKYRTVAIDTSFYTSYTNQKGDEQRKEYHHILWLKCKECGHRTFDRGGVQQHSGVEKVRLRWLEQHIIAGADGLEVYDDDYSIVDPANPYFFNYKPLTGVDRIIKLLKKDTEFKKLCEHQMVEDAFGELETVIKMHENLDKP